MTKYIVKASKTIDYSFLVEANSKEEAEQKYNRFNRDELNASICEVSTSDLDVVWDVEETESDTKTYAETGGWENLEILSFWCLP